MFCPRRLFEYWLTSQAFAVRSVSINMIADYYIPAGRAIIAPLWFKDEARMEHVISIYASHTQSFRLHLARVSVSLQRSV